MTVKKNEIHCTEVNSGFSAISLKKLCFSRILQVLLKSLLFAIFTGIIAFFAHYISDRFIFHVHGRPGNEKVLLMIYQGAPLLKHCTPHCSRMILFEECPLL